MGISIKCQPDSLYIFFSDRQGERRNFM